ncbi:2-hydroxyacid dehydrogenase [Variovorax dokdonensis]|uniref:2-hydroxyacid dehydrogenase n=1 Tax=Variovorax dokdonensis TaxID=344883 RepID=A0ABT7NB67_9BURK|nr:2-hydroxyacid dehydrogenase [Variovorax dokdonensis]MDM0045191.1 2-hydroxyacid dehydrogenase [Variovorax dokdonensis]
MNDRIPLLVLNSLLPEHQAQIGAQYELIYAITPQARAEAVATHGARIRVVLTIGVVGLTAAEVDAMPALELVCCMGAGYEGLPLEMLKQRGIATANGAGTNDDCVADHAFGLIIGIIRGMRTLDAQCRAGIWREEIPQPPNVSGKKLGIFGLGTIGQKIAKRAGGFDMPVGYHNRKPKEGVQYRYAGSLIELAKWCDVLVCATPGGPATRHAVNAQVLDALGPRGYLINISRGSVVDTDALAAALRDRRIAGAGLDVYESEPHRPEALIGLDNLLITPHMAGWSPEATQASVDRFMANAAGHFAGLGVVSPI